MTVVVIAIVVFLAYRAMKRFRSNQTHRNRRVAASLIWSVIGAVCGSFAGVAAFGGAIAGTVPGAIVGYLVASNLLKTDRG